MKYDTRHINTRQLLLIAVCFFIALQLQAQHKHEKMSTDKPATHGMLVFGKEKVYASHLPMFYSPHDYQILLELALSDTDKQRYLADKEKHPNMPTYTIQPERFVLPEMVNNPRPFKVNLYRGHFERGGVLILEDIPVSITKLVYFKKFDPKESKTLTSDFILFGNEKEQFLVHQISNKPDFEQVIEVSTTLSSFVSNEKYGLVTLNASANSPVGISGNNVVVNEHAITLLEQVYLEFSDLKN